MKAIICEYDSYHSSAPRPVSTLHILLSCRDTALQKEIILVHQDRVHRGSDSSGGGSIYYC